MTKHPDRWLPTVSVVVPVLNEAPYIERCLRSALAQDYPSGQIDIVVADGGSTDGTREIVARLAARDERIRLVDNPRRNQAAGLNEAISGSTGEIVARLDGHAEWRPWHLSRCIAVMDETGADNVGGTMEAVGETPTGKAVALASSSPFGAGGARYRTADHQMLTDTVWLGCFRRTALERVGPFNEAYPPHEDYELNHRILATGGQVVFSPDIPTTYWTRSSWPALIRQYFRYGRGKARVARHDPGVVRPYHLVPVALVGGLVLGTLMRRTRHGVGAAMVFYGAACAIAGVPAGEGAPREIRMRIPFVFAAMHIFWGAGFWAGLLEPSKHRHLP